MLTQSATPPIRSNKQPPIQSNKQLPIRPNKQPPLRPNKQPPLASSSSSQRSGTPLGRPPSFQAPPPPNRTSKPSN